MTTIRSQTIGTRDVVFIALLAAIIVALGLVPAFTIGVVPVPITLQPLGVMLAGALIGPVRGMLSCALVALMTAMGLPVLAGGRGGLGIFAGPTGGYLVGWMFAAAVTGLLVKYWAVHRTSRRARIGAIFLACVAGGMVVDYAFGIPWMSVTSGMSLGKATIGGMAFVPGDLIKAAVAALITENVLRSYSIRLF